MSNLQKLNNIKDVNRIAIGQKITVPKASTLKPSVTATYTVKSGDTLSKIAVNNGTTVAKLQAFNRI